MFTRDENPKKLKALTPVKEQVNALERSVSSMTAGDMQAAMEDMRTRVASLGCSLDDSLPLAYALVRESTRRVLGIRPYDVQIMGAIALHYGYACEMGTGEGKTIVAAFPAFLNALTGKGVHVVTVNSYLAARDSQQIGRIHEYLGLSTGLVSETLAPNSPARRQEYAKDITYGTTSEFGFDYLRDNMVLSAEDKVQRGLHYAIVDEVDSILVDEARTPLIISDSAYDAEDLYRQYSDLVATFDPAKDVHIFADKRTVHAADSASRLVEQHFSLDNLYDGTNAQHVHHLSVAMYAKFILENGVDYIVQHDEVLIVDEFTGRILPGRRWGDGRHQAVEAKEKVSVVKESRIGATISIQAYYQMYDKLAGMTGTAAAAEFFNVYKLPIVSIPPNKISVRIDHPDVMYATYDSKITAVCSLVQSRRKKGQPVLIGTSSVEESEQISKALDMLNENHRVLNARDHSKEANIIAQAGRWGEVTVATNMAGRGVDILLGGNVEFLTELAYAAWIKDRDVSLLSAEVLQDVRSQIHRQLGELCASDAEEIKGLGGLLVIGIAKNASQRIDRQLKGRAGRQGDPGETQFHISMEDKLMQVYAKSSVASFMSKNRTDGVLEGAAVARLVSRAQNGVEMINSKTREDLVKYDDVLVAQAKEVYRNRDFILGASGPEMELVTKKCTKVFIETIFAPLQEEHDGQTGTAFANVEFMKYFKTNLIPHTGSAVEDHYASHDTYKWLRDLGIITADTLLQGSPEHSDLEVRKLLYINVLDSMWRQHLGDLARIREGIHLRAVGQKDPLHEWKKDAYDLFTEFDIAVKIDYTRNLLSALFDANP